jgi:hypothetical protein
MDVGPPQVGLASPRIRFFEAQFKPFVHAAPGQWIWIRRKRD